MLTEKKKKEVSELRHIKQILKIPPELLQLSLRHAMRDHTFSFFPRATWVSVTCDQIILSNTYVSLLKNRV